MFLKSDSLGSPKAQLYGTLTWPGPGQGRKDYLSLKLLCST
jgi:hypothetical protein